MACHKLGRVQLRPKVDFNAYDDDDNGIEDVDRDLSISLKRGGFLIVVEAKVGGDLIALLHNSCIIFTIFDFKHGLANFLCSIRIHLDGQTDVMSVSHKRWLFPFLVTIAVFNPRDGIVHEEAMREARVLAGKAVIWARSFNVAEVFDQYGHVNQLLVGILEVEFKERVGRLW